MAVLADDPWGALHAHGVGALIVHLGREAAFAVLDMWVDETMLRHHFWASSCASPKVREGPGHAQACTLRREVGRTRPGVRFEACAAAGAAPRFAL